ncbi:MAG: FtsX-like permease family protein [Blastocatellia bacterium]|nr:FtsX-like permease family protein [Blastocatellia bacterium]
MKFVFRMALSELKASWRRLILFFLCIAIGVGSIVSLRSLIHSVNTSVTLEARSLMAADIEISSRREWTPAQWALIEPILAGTVGVVRNQVLETPTMCRPVTEGTDITARVELRGVEAGYPFYGTITLADGTVFSHDLLRNHGIVAQPGLLFQLQAKVGDWVKIGATPFQIRGVIQDDPGSGLTAFSLGPRVLVDRKDLTESGLFTYGTRGRFRLLLKVPEAAVQPLNEKLKQALKTELVAIKSFRESQDQLNAQFTQVENFFSLAGLIVLILGGIGVSSVIQVFIAQRMKSIAVLKCLGSSSRGILGIYLTQVALLAVTGCAFGVGLAFVTVWLVPKYFLTDFPIAIAFRVTRAAVVQGFGVGLLIAFLFSIVPLLEIRHIKPLLLLRGETSQPAIRFDWLRWVTSLLVVAGLVAVAAWQAGSFRVGAYFLAGLAGTGLVLLAVSWLLITGLRGMRVLPVFVLRQGINNLYRPGNQTRVIVLSTGLGVFFIMAVNLIQQNLLTEFNFTLLQNASDMFLIDIQPDQQHPVFELLSQASPAKVELVPTLRARLVALNGAPIELESLKSEAERNRLGREYTITYTDKLGPNERIVAGTFWDRTPSPEPEVSVEEALYQSTGLKVGNTLTVDVLGRKITARISSLRKVDWRNSRTGFVILFRPGVLESAPHTFIAGIKGPAEAAGRTRLQAEIVRRFPNITVIDVLDILQRSKAIINGFTLAISFIGGFVFLCGVLILVGSIALSKLQRRYETAILKTLGAQRNTIFLIACVEYGILGLLAGLVGSGAAVGLAWAVTVKILKISWHWLPATNLIGVLATVLLVVLVGIVSTVDVVLKKPLGVLRSE